MLRGPGYGFVSGICIQPVKTIALHMTKQHTTSSLRKLRNLAAVTEPSMIS